MSITDPFDFPGRDECNFSLKTGRSHYAVVVERLEPIYSTALKALEISDELYMRLMGKGWFIYALPDGDPRQFELRNAQITTAGYLTARRVEGSWSGIGADTLASHISQIAPVDIGLSRAMARRFSEGAPLDD